MLRGSKKEIFKRNLLVRNCPWYWNGHRSDASYCATYIYATKVSEVKPSSYWRIYWRDSRNCGKWQMKNQFQEKLLTCQLGCAKMVVEDIRALTNKN